MKTFYLMTSGTWAFSRDACFIQGVFLGECAFVWRPVASLTGGQVTSSLLWLQSTPQPHRGRAAKSLMYQQLCRFLADNLHDLINPAASVVDREKCQKVYHSLTFPN